MRTPALRRLAKEFAKREDVGAFLDALPHGYYDENNLHGFLLCEDKDFDRVIATNLRSAFITSRFLARHRESNGNTAYGRIVNLCSSRYLMSEPGTEGYAASKGGIYSLTHALSISLAPYRITVNAIAPGWIHVNEDEVLLPEDHDFHPSRRVGEPGDIARMALFLCEEKNDFVNGQTITVDGGVTRKMIYPE